MSCPGKPSARRTLIGNGRHSVPGRSQSASAKYPVRWHARLKSGSCGFSRGPARASVPSGLLTGGGQPQIGPCTPLRGTADLRPVHRSEILKTGPLACSQLISSPARHCGCWGAFLGGGSRELPDGAYFPVGVHRGR